VRGTVWIWRIGIAAAVFAGLAPARGPDRRVSERSYREWKVYGGGPEGLRYSSLDEINRRNVARLEKAWTFDTGDAFPNSEMQCNPIVVDGVLYATTPKLRVIALDAATGALRWAFEPPDRGRPLGKARNRGVTYWEGAEEKRIYFVARQYLYALDARTGALAAGFGQAGRIDLREGLGRDPATLNVSATTPGAVYRDLLILGSITSESLPAAPGDIRAFDLRTGRLRWSFHTIPHPGEAGYDTWPGDAWKYIGGANCWSGLTVDERRGLVFAGTGSAAFDFYGANRLGDNLFANSLLALRADTGERVWHFQFVKHDVWDRDLPAPPCLVTVRRSGKSVDGVAQLTKSGHVFVFDRENGKPLFPVEYRRVAASDVPGEALAETQPFPVRPPAFARQTLTEETLTRRTAAAHDAVLARFRALRGGAPFVPPSFQGTIVFPGFDGGAEWGGPAFDPATGLLYVNSNEMAWVLRLVDRPKPRSRTTGKELYLRYCSACHRADRAGSPPEFPALVGIGERASIADIARMTREGSGRMSGFSSEIEPDAVRAIAEYLVSGAETEVLARTAPSPIDLPYHHDGYNKFLDPDGYPATSPPWGTLNAIDLDEGKIAWTIPFGEFPELAAKGMGGTGTENYGGPLVTAGGLVFIGATNHDRKFHAYDKATGKLLWETLLPAAGNATPATYKVGGRQYVVIGAGGGKSGAPSGGSYVAFALPSDH